MCSCEQACFLRAFVQRKGLYIRAYLRVFSKDLLKGLCLRVLLKGLLKGLGLGDYLKVFVKGGT